MQVPRSGRVRGGGKHSVNFKGNKIGALLSSPSLVIATLGLHCKQDWEVPAGGCRWDGVGDPPDRACDVDIDDGGESVSGLWCWKL